MPEAPQTRRFQVVAGATYTDWEAVYTDNAVAVYRLVFRRVGNRPDAEDLTEEVFLAALPRLRLPAPVLGIRAYLMATVRTVLATHWRHYYATPETQMDLEHLAPESLEAPGEAGAGRANRILGLLPDRFRQILELRFLRGYSVREAALEMGVSVSNAKVLQYRALRHAAEIGREVLS